MNHFLLHMVYNTMFLHQVNYYKLYNKNIQMQHYMDELNHIV